MFTPKANLKQKMVKKSEIRRIWFTKIAARFYVKKSLNILPAKSRHGCKNRGTILTASGPKISFSKSAFSTILGPSKVRNQTQTHPILHTNVI